MPILGRGERIVWRDGGDGKYESESERNQLVTMQTFFVIGIITAAIGYLIWRVARPQKHDCPDCSAAHHAAKVRQRRAR